LPKRNNSRSLRTTRSAEGYIPHADVDNSITGGKTKIIPLARVVQGTKKLHSPILIAGFPGAVLIGSLGKITDNESLKIDTRQLREEGTSIKGRMEEIVQSYISQQQRDQSPKSVREGIMYG
jgi:hypothetical protein